MQVLCWDSLAKMAKERENINNEIDVLCKEHLEEAGFSAELTQQVAGFLAARRGLLLAFTHPEMPPEQTKVTYQGSLENHSTTNGEVVFTAFKDNLIRLTDTNSIQITTVVSPFDITPTGSDHGRGLKYLPNQDGSITINNVVLPSWMLQALVLMTALDDLQQGVWSAYVDFGLVGTFTSEIKAINDEAAFITSTVVLQQQYEN
jgi:hypothetical protein